MKSAPRFRLFLCLLLAAIGILHAAETTPSAPETPNPGKKQEVTKLDGTKLFGLIEITDDYTIRIKSDSGIKNIPLASLAEKDFRKFGFIKDQDRSKDGKLWSQRKDALEEEKKSEDQESKSKEKKSESSSDIEIRLAELAPLQPLISAYESMNPKKDSSEDKKDPNSKEEEDPTKKADTASGKSSTLHMFTGPGSLNLPNVPFASSAAETVISPATSAASTITGVVPSIAPPLTPSAP